jgi:predicted amidohydrolase YtcJ
MAREGLGIGFSSDFPISGPNPMVGIHAAVSRRTERGARIHPEQGIGVAEALRMYTLDAAAAGFEETTRGSLSPGKFADLILLDQNPLTADADRLKDIRVEMTVLGGRIVWPI